MRSSVTIALISVIFCISCVPASTKQAEKKQENASKVEFVGHEPEQRVDVMIDGKLFTSYCWPDTVYKPVLYPILTSAGTEITRGFPVKPRAGERTDHRHQVGMWLNYGDVNGYDFWGNGHAGKRDIDGGQIKHLSVEELSGGTGEGIMVTTESWIDPAGKELLSERTEYHFVAKGPTRIIDRLTTLTAAGEAVNMKDTKEGMFGIRVARQLELPSEKDVTLTDAHGNPTTVKALTNEGVSGNYQSSEGIKGEAVWSTRARWMNLYGNIGDEKISLVICDHPKNLSYPTYWHARGYGLFAANPFGAHDFTNKKETLNYSIPAGESLTFRYRVIISSGAHLTEAEINTHAADFAGKY